MTEISHVNIERAKMAPESEFASPSEITNSVGMTRAEKLTALRGWSFEVQRRLDSADEGMAPELDPERPGEISRDAELLQELELEIQTLESIE